VARRTPVRRPPVGGGLLSIGALSAATGIPADTLRTWERRYGFPLAERKPSGHRVYPLSTVPRLRRMAQAIAGGHRPAQVLPASERLLDGLLATLTETPSEPASAIRGASRSAAPTEIADLFAAVRGFDADRLRAAFHLEWARLGPLEFLEQRATALLAAIGSAWAEGSLDVRHEHFASSVLGDFLRTVRLPLDDRASGPIVALATLPGELHGLGLQMSALVFALAGWRALILGVDTPVEQIAALAREAPLAAVALSCVQSRSRGFANTIRSLRRRLPRHISLLVGGAGAPPAAGQRGIEIIPDLGSLDRWLHSRPST
jgi:MerR family transcriptional regulator, light-induced transcriptional regulator